MSGLGTVEEKVDEASTFAATAESKDHRRYGGYAVFGMSQEGEQFEATEEEEQVEVRVPHLTAVVRAMWTLSQNLLVGESHAHGTQPRTMSTINFNTGKHKCVQSN